MKADIKTAIETGIVMNLDNEYEAEMVDELLKNQCKDFQPNIIGMRINPVVGGGEHAILSTATKLSKFGVPLMAETKVYWMIFKVFCANYYKKLSILNYII